MNKFRFYFIVPIVMSFLYATMYNTSFIDAIKWIDADDVYKYLIISKAAPLFPAEQISFHFAQRFIPHYLVGSFSSLTHLPLFITYTVFNILLLSIIMIVAIRLLFKEQQSIIIKILVFSFFALSPFAFRLNVLVPGMMADMVFVLGLTISMTGLLDKKAYFIVTGLLIATIGKQSSLLILPGILLYTYAIYKNTWGHIKTAIFILITTTLTIALYMWLAIISKSFATPNFITKDILFSIFPWIFSSQFSFILLIDHIFRTFLPAFPFIILFFLGYENKNLHAWFSLQNIALILIFLVPVAYVFLPGPLVNGHNVSRYTASVLLPLAIFTLNNLEKKQCQVKIFEWPFVIFILAAFSYHHKYTFLTSTPKMFLIVHVISLIFIVIFIKVKVLGFGD